ncbi:hypothetical protein DL546_001322 [Coniochaeta pulveracea]|uniref:DNA damage-responsive protein 48 n=1 Tax=Coniochaeta pulveracea TaxID=177199 RepID=A0A420YHX1_9PEZI|nr:hypothetical protein DL546_001322 [Coniochaeta pulveracea]
MDYINKAIGGGNSQNAEGTNQNVQTGQQTSSSSGGGFMDKLQGMAGGGRESEKNEDYVDKGVDYVQEHVLGQGPQDNENAIEQAKDEQISDFIRGQAKGFTGGKDYLGQDK